MSSKVSLKWELIPYSWVEIPEEQIPWNWQTYYLAIDRSRRTRDRIRERIQPWKKRSACSCEEHEGDDSDLNSIEDHAQE